MENTLSVSLMIAFLLIGVVGGAVLLAGEDVVREVEVPGEVVKVPTNVTVEVEVPVADVRPYLDQAIEDFLDYVDEEELFSCDEYDYDFDEITISRVYNYYSVAIDEDEHTVDFSIRLKYDEDDERSCRESFDVEAYYEEDEDVEITIA